MMKSLPLVCFIDAFGTYRNMYRSLTGVYMTPAGLDQLQRSRRVNNFALTLGPHASDIGVIMAGMKDLKTLDRGMEMEVNGETVWFCPYIHVYIGDMQQQNANAGLLAPTATRSCRQCLVKTSQRADLAFDIVGEGRFYHQMRDIRDQYGSIMAKTTYEKLCSRFGLRANETPLIQITKGLDPYRDCPSEGAHLIYNGLGKRSQTLLITAIFTIPSQK